MAISIANQWSGTFTQPTSIGNMPPALQSTVIALGTASSVGGGSGTPSTGNWLFASVGWNSSSLPTSTVAVSDDIHSFWHPGNENSSAWATSPSSGTTRTVIWYTPNLASVPQNVYVAPNGMAAATTCLVTEVSGLGAWDTVTAVSGGFSAASTSVTLALGAPAAQAFFLSSATSDNTAVTQGMSGGTALHTVASGALAQMTSAYSVSSSVVTLNGTASTSRNLSGAIVGVLAAGSSPVPAGGNPNWPYLKVEAAFGGGFQTPPDQLTWQDLSSRAWSWDETTGVQFQLGQLQATNLLMDYDNYDNKLSPDNVASPYYSNALNSNMSFNGAVSGTGQLSPWTGNNNATLSVVSSPVHATGAGAVSQFSLKVTPDGVTGSPGTTSEQVTISPSLGIDDGTFESGVANWTATGGTVAQSSAHAHLGTFSALLTVSGSPAQSILRPNDKVPVVPGQSYTATMWLYGASVANCGAAIDWYTAASAYISTSSGTTGTATTSFTLFQVTGTAPSNAAFAVYGPTISSSPANGTALYTDDVYFVATPSGTYSSSSWYDVPAGWATGAQASISWYTPDGTYISSAYSTQTACTAGVWTNAILSGASPPAGTSKIACVAQLAGTPSAATVFYVAEAAVTAGGSAVQTGLIATGTPVRIRAALGSIGGNTYNRWYQILRHFQQLPQKVTGEFRRYAPTTGTDIWSTMAVTGNSPYSGEVAQDGPYAWWKCADQLLPGGILPTSLINSAQGNSNVLNIKVSPSGATIQDVYSTTGTDLTTGIGVAPDAGVANPAAIYALPVNPGWMYGDAASSFSSLSTASGGELTSVSGASSVQFTGQGGNTGSHGWWMYCNDSGFPGLSAGVTIEGWFNYAFLGSATGVYDGTNFITYDAQGQPVTALTLWEIATGSNPVCVLQLNSSGHLQLITYNGASGTTHSIYTTTDLRAGAWFHVAVTLTTSAWNVLVNGGTTANVSGSGAGMTSAWTWLIVNGDLAANGGSTAGTGLVHGGNIAVSHLAVYPSVLPLYRIQAHYWAACTAFGVIPAPQSVQVSVILITDLVNNTPATEAYSWTPDGGTDGGHTGDAGYGQSAGNPVAFAFSAIVAAVIGSYNSGPSAWSMSSGTGVTEPAAHALGNMVYVSWAGLSENFNVYTAAQVNSETGSAVVLSNSESFSSGTGSGASTHSPGNISTGSGASPPTSPSAVADTAGQRLERILAYGKVTSPRRSIDPAPLAVQAATDIGGQQVSQNLINIQQSDNGLLFIDNNGYLCYWQKSHLASQYSSPVSTLGPAATPYDRDFDWLVDPQRVWNAITVQQFAPDQSSQPYITPEGTSASGATVAASQAQYGAQPLNIQSYLSSTTEIQTQANWLFTTYGQANLRADNVKIDAARYLAGWGLVLGVNVGDVVTMQNWQVGGGEVTQTFRVSGIKRRFDLGSLTQDMQASVILTLDPEPASYWS